MTPFSPHKPCRDRNCPGVAIAFGYCKDHQGKAKRYGKAQAKAYDKQRGTTTERGYGAQHQKVRARYLKEHPLCEKCLEVGRTTPILDGGGVLHHKDGDAFNIWDDNLMALCRDCHERIEGRLR